MLNAIWVLVRARLQIMRNSFWRGSLRSKIGLVALLALAGTGAVAIYLFTRFVVSGLRDPEFAAVLREAAEQTPGLITDVGLILAAVPSLVLFFALTLLIFSSFSSLLSSLYLSGDIDMLLAAPVPMRAVFVVKFFGGLAPQYLLLMVLLGPVLVGYGQGMEYGLLYQLCGVLALLLMPLLPAGLGALLVMAVVRVLPAQRAREIVSVLGGLIGIGFYLVSQFARELAPRLSNPDNLNALLASDFPLLPSAWAGRALVAAGEGRALPLVVFGGLFVGCSLAVFVGCLLLAERLYYEGWANLANAGGSARRKARGARSNDAAERAPFTFYLPRQSWTILVKDLRLFTRDLRNLQQLIFPLALAGVWTVRLFTQPPARDLDDAPAWLGQLNDLGGAGIAFFICLSLSSALAGAGVSREGKSFWLLKLAPISALRLLLGKLALAYLPYPTVGTLFLLLLALIGGSGPLVLLQQWLLLLLVGLGCAAFGIGLGATFVRLDWENPQQQTTWQVGCLGLLFYPLYLLVVVVLVAGSALLASGFSGATGLGVQLAGWTLAALITAGVVWLGTLLGTRGLERIEL